MNNKNNNVAYQEPFYGLLWCAACFYTRKQENAAEGQQRAKKRGEKMEQDREFYIVWCALLSGDAETYFSKMTDQELEAKYNELLGKATQEIEGERS